ncbi:60S ribosomal protein L36A/L44 [Anaeramoeba flamelloides]|uniref:60S ribosomal protein L36A/L44 n=1 Tax=Anaeramoeba flamelloides TaxID=1746091 RepID=A0AAV7YZW8_9EUKA|nr:60S ribosomal protein L36A/L44 [Anaeramoeba flamelloides]KAJ3425938.1 60S ribosomal protein L36A/L44 [Anaeramoeba flamelloides]KAJ3427074.1 60S ribosomal protein L36A/L44 [Anaeramoeba flamelloides]KAJ3428623.1 60S ribosomal protein L36A/L44 [Anaeramoeba flamelloides]KAJ3430761.1 60S ribosomal protein L36A/L44 [Anaeramoeba flamelloides]|eukprot:Anaeramoba_flamelloidesa567567_297.p1 GENE.a567567_297~~a567567_297.p1  ORF type:complete len:104 (+),score=19.62 a567567_297:29-340(+)
MVFWPKTKRTFCRKCKKHTVHKVGTAKKGKESSLSQGRRRYDRKQSGHGGQTKPIFHKKVKQTKKIVAKLTCSKCKQVRVSCVRRCKRFEIADSKGKKNEPTW